MAYKLQTVIFICILLIENDWVLIEIFLKLVPRVAIDRKTTLIQTIIWCLTIELHEPILTKFYDAMLRQYATIGWLSYDRDIVHWSSAPHNRIANRTGFSVYVVLVLNVIRYSCHYFLDRIIFHHDFHHDSCDYHWVFLWTLITF